MGALRRLIAYVFLMPPPGGLFVKCQHNWIHAVTSELVWLGLRILAWSNSSVTDWRSLRPKAMSAFTVVIRSKADMTFCTAHVRL